MYSFVYTLVCYELRRIRNIHLKKSLLPTPRTGKNFLVPRANKDRKVSSLVSSLGGKKGAALRPSTSMSLPSPRSGPTLGSGPSVSGGAPDLFSQPPPGTNGMPKLWLVTTLSKERVLTQQQADFIDHLLGEAKGDYKKAMAMAGYAETTRPSDIIKSLRNEIIEASLNHLALNAPKAAVELTDVMSNPVQGGATTKVKVATQILDRVGVTAAPKDALDLKIPSGGLFIMPAKETPPWSVKKEEDNEL